MKRKKILLLSDDMRMHSGIARMSREIVQGTLHKYDWAQIGGAINHPEKGKRITIQSDSFFTLPDNSSITIYPVDGYGDANMLREVIRIEKPDVILHFTDPRFWVWLYQMEHELRQNIPIMYYNIWDDLPDPMWNENYYRSSDMLLSISKQTYGINKRILHDYEDWQLDYVPHGIDSKKLYKVSKQNSKLLSFKADYGLDDYKFIVLYVNRNIRRKNPGDCLLAFKHMVSKLTDEEKKECCFLFHSAPVDENGTDMRAIARDLCPGLNIVFTHDVGNPSFDDEKMNLLYNSADVYMNLASNEGFGLGSCEALTVGTPIVVNVTGGLQDQCGFKNEKGEYLTAEDYVELGSNHRGKYKDHGEWVKPVFPSNISCQGSPMTPYIFDDRCQYEDAGEALLHWYKAGSDERERCGQLGMEFVNDENIGMSAKEMTKGFLNNFENLFKNWKPKQKFTMEVM